MAELLSTNAEIQAEKAATVDAGHEKLKAAKVAIVTEYNVIKNTLVRRALKDTAYGDLDRLLDGPNGWVFGYEDPIAVSKTLIKFIEENEKLKIKGALFEGEFMDQAKVKVLSQMPSKPELQAKLLALMQAPATQLVRLMQEPAAMLVRLMDTVRRQKESQGS